MSQAPVDDNERLRERVLPNDPEDDAEPLLREEHRIFDAKWKTVADHGGLEWFEVAPPKRDWLLELPGDNAETGERKTGILPLGKVGMLAAAGAAGKTMALIELALAVATGREWLDTYTTPNPGHVLLALGEEDLEEVRRRIYAAARLMRLTDEQRRTAAERIVVLALAGSRLALTDDHGETTAVFRELQARLHASSHEWRLIVLDPLSRFAGKDAEVDNHAATACVETLEVLAQTPGKPTVLVAHHTTKASRSADGDASSAAAARGASALTDGVRWVANLEPDRSLPDRLRLTITKTNYSLGAPALTLVRDDGGALRAETPREREIRESRAREARTASKASNNGTRSAVSEEDY